MTAHTPPPLPLPLPLWVVSLAALAAGTVMLFWGAWSSGASLDESYHVQRMQNFLDHGWFLIDAQMAATAPAEDVADRFVYGPVTMGLLHGLAVLCGVEGPGEIAATPEAYAVRHVGIALIALVGVAATTATGRLVLGSWRWGAWTGALLVVIPLWTGHAMLNPKDISVASGYAVLTLGLMLLALDRTAGPLVRLPNVLLVALGVTLAVGTRPGMWAGVVVSVAAFVVLRVVADLRGRVPREGTRVERASRYLDLALGLGLAAAVLAIVYPAIFLSPVEVMVRSASSSSDYEGASAGAWWYIPAYVAVTVPILVIVLAGIGIFGAARGVLRKLGRPSAAEVRLALIGVQALALPVVAMILEAKLYNGLRHFLFALPAIAVLCAVGLRAILEAEVVRRRLYTTVVSVVVTVGMLLPLADQVRLFPYNYTYYNEIAETAGVDAQTDWWWTSGRKLVEHFPRGSYVTCLRQLSSDDIAYPQWMDQRSDCLRNPIGTLAPYAEGATAPAIKPPLSEVEFLAASTEVTGVADNCQVIHEVVLPRRWHDAVMGRALRCILVAPTYRGVVTFPPTSALDASVLEGWVDAAPMSGMVLVGQGGRLAVGIPAAWREHSLVVRLSVTNAGALAAIRVNGVGQRFDVRTADDPDGGEVIDIRVPGDLAGRRGEGRLILTLEPTGAAEQGNSFRLHSLELSQLPAAG